MNDAERLAEALRQANAELQVEPAELAAAMKRGHRRLVGRLLAVAVLSAIGAALLLSGGLAASHAIKENRRNTADHHDDQQKASGGKRHKKEDDSDNGKGGKRDDGKGKKQGEKHKQHDRSEHAIGGGTEAPEAELPELVVTDVTESEVVVKNESSVPATESFYVLVTIPGTEFEEELVFDEGLGAGKTSRRDFKEEAPCAAEKEIIAEVDAGKSVTESEDENNKASTDCAELQEEEEEEGKSSVDGYEAARRAM